MYVFGISNDDASGAEVSDHKLRRRWNVGCLYGCSMELAALEIRTEFRVTSAPLECYLWPTPIPQSNGAEVSLVTSAPLECHLWPTHVPRNNGAEVSSPLQCAYASGPDTPGGPVVWHVGGVCRRC